jgi:hypothetical protein
MLCSVLLLLITIFTIPDYRGYTILAFKPTNNLPTEPPAISEPQEQASPANGSASETTSQQIQEETTSQPTANAELTASRTASDTFTLQICNETYPINYKINGHGNEVNSLSPDLLSWNETLSMDLSSKSDGKLTIDIPKDLQDLLDSSGSFRVFIDYVESDTFSVNTDSGVSTLTIPFEKRAEDVRINITPEHIREFSDPTLLLEDKANHPICKEGNVENDNFVVMNATMR